MSIEEFVEKYKKAQDKQKFLHKHVTVQYVNFATKLLDCTNMIEKSCYTEINGVRKFRINSVARYLLYVLNVISRYTDIEIDFEHAMDSYDKMNENGLINEVMAAIPVSEISEYDTVLNMMLDDLMENERSLAGWVEGKQEMVNQIFDQILSLNSGDTDETKTGS